MDYLEQMLEDLESGGQLIIKVSRAEGGLIFEGFIIDTENSDYIVTERATLDLVISELDRLAEQWLIEKSTP